MLQHADFILLDAAIMQTSMDDAQARKVAHGSLFAGSPAKLSLVISGKQKPDVALVKAAYTELQLDGNMLLRAL